MTLYSTETIAAQHEEEGYLHSRNSGKSLLLNTKGLGPNVQQKVTLRQKSPVDVTQPSVSRILFVVVLCDKGRGPFMVDTFSEFRGSQMVVKVCAIVFYWTSGDRK